LRFYLISRCTQRAQWPFSWLRDLSSRSNPSLAVLARPGALPRDTLAPVGGEEHNIYTDGIRCWLNCARPSATNWRLPGSIRGSTLSCGFRPRATKNRSANVCGAKVCTSKASAKFARAVDMPPAIVVGYASLHHERILQTARAIG